MIFGACTTAPSELTLLKEYGYSCFESNFQRIKKMTDEELDELRCAVEKTGIMMAGMNCFAPTDVRILRWSEQEAVEYFESGIKRARPLGLRYLVIGSGKARTIPEEMSREEGVKRWVSLLRRFGDIAEQYDIDVYVEPLRHYETNMINTVSEAAELCKAVDHPRIGCMADFYHMHMVEEPFCNIQNAGKLLRHIHVSTADRRVPLHSDREELLAMIAALKECGYDGRVVLEGEAKPNSETAFREFSEQFDLFR